MRHRRQPGSIKSRRSGQSKQAVYLRPVPVIRKGVKTAINKAAPISPENPYDSGESFMPGRERPDGPPVGRPAREFDISHPPA